MPFTSIQSSYQQVGTTGPTWEIKSTGLFNNFFIGALAHSNGTYVFGVSGAAGYSLDGETWVEGQTLSIGYNCEDAGYGNNMFLMVQGNGILHTSVDGISWDLQTSSFGTSVIRGVDYGNGTFVAVGAFGKVATSTDGVLWTQNPTLFTAEWLYSVRYLNGSFITVGNNGTIATSPDGINWTTQTSTFGSTRIFQVTYGNGLYVAVGRSNTVSTSPDAENWTAVDTSSFAVSDYETVAFGANRFLAGGSNRRTIESTDGINWIDESREDILPNSNYVTKVVFDGTQFVVGGTAGTIATYGPFV